MTAPVSLHIFSCLKNGYPGCSHRLHSCLMFPRVRSVYLHEKRFSRPRSSKELHKKGKRIELINNKEL